MAEATFKIYLYGSPRVVTPDGRDVTPRGAKAQALIALLATPAGRTWSRMALQDKLWSDRGPQHGRNSLKQELLTLRKVFAVEGDDVLVLRGKTVQLREDAVRVDVFDPELRAEDNGPILPQFLEGCDVRDPEFEDWLRCFRAKLDEPDTSNHHVINVERSFNPDLSRYKIALLPVIGPPDDIHCDVVGELITDRIAISLRQLDLFEIIDYRLVPSESSHRGADFSLRPRILRLSSDLALTLLAHDVQSQELFWAEKRVLALEKFGAEEIACLVAEALDQIVAAILRKSREGDPERRLAARYALDGIDLMLRIRNPNIDGASDALRRAIEIEPRGPYLAFYAFQTLFRLEESKGGNLGELRERADELVAMALEADPHNPISRALITHVYSFVFRDFDRAESLIRPLASSPPDSPIYFHSLAALSLYTGRVKEAREAAIRASDMARYNVYSHAFSTTLAMVDTVGNNLDAAIEQGERVVALHRGSERIYEPALRYLAAAYGLRGDALAAGRVMQLIRRQSPGFTLSSLDDTRYPVPSEITRQVLRQGLAHAAGALDQLEEQQATSNSRKIIGPQ